jgi:tetratricopeptide (TPR) repeat protein
MTKTLSPIFALIAAISLMAAGFPAARAQIPDRNPSPAANTLGTIPDPADEKEYDDCLALLDRKPTEAFEIASRWRAGGGGLPAQHCEALALIEVGRFGDGATRLMKAAQDAVVVRPDMAASLFGQAGNAWFLAGEPRTAISAFDAAIKRAPDNADLFIDRGFAHYSLEQWAEARSSLDRALTLDPAHAEALALRASIRRQTGDLEGAASDADAALRLDSGHREALLERGLVRLARNDKAGARADWAKLLDLAPQSPAADAARRHLENLDVKIPGGAAPAPAPAKR